jgi:hypothetical protein
VRALRARRAACLGVSPCNSPPPARLLFDGCRSGSADHDVPTLRGILLVSALDGPGNVRAGDVRSGAGDVPTLSRRLKVREARLQLPLAGSARVEQESCSAGVVSATDSLRHMPRLASFPAMMQRGRKREGLRVCRAAWLGRGQRPGVSRDRGQRALTDVRDLGSDLQAERVAADVRGVLNPTTSSTLKRKSGDATMRR